VLHWAARNEEAMMPRFVIHLAKEEVRRAVRADVVRMLRLVDPKQQLEINVNVHEDGHAVVHAQDPRPIKPKTFRDWARR
jgi:hypothetical protein